MASTKVKAIIIGGVNVKEKDKLLTLFTLEQGKMSVSMKGVRGDKAKLKSAKDVFTFGDFIVEEGKFTNIITSVDIIDNFYELSKDIEKYYEACAIVDIVSKVATEPNPQLFIELIKALKSLCYDNVKKYYVINKFLLSLFANMGIKYLNLQVGELVCPNCRSSFSMQISNACYSALKLLENTDYDKLSTVKLGGMGEVQAFNLLSKNYEYRTGYKILEIL